MRRSRVNKFVVLLLAVAANGANGLAQDKPDAPAPKQADAPSPQSSSTEKTPASDKSDKSKDVQGKGGQGQTAGAKNFATIQANRGRDRAPESEHGSFSRISAGGRHGRSLMAGFLSRSTLPTVP